MGADWVTQKVFALGACHLVLADKCRRLLREAFPDPPLSPASFRMASQAPLAPCSLLDWLSLCLQSEVTDCSRHGGPQLLVLDGLC